MCYLTARKVYTQLLDPSLTELVASKSTYQWLWMEKKIVHSSKEHNKAFIKVEWKMQPCLLLSHEMLERFLDSFNKRQALRQLQD